MSGLWTSAEIAAATGGEATRAFAASGLSIDTRTLHPGDLFVALTDLRDGHDFVRAALDGGAAGALVARLPGGCSADDPLVIVPEVLPALEAIARVARSRSRARVIGVTGSVGKTSTKDMLRVILAGQGDVHAAEASFNNHWGVPLTLARLPADTDVAVIEIGMNHPGEIAPLARLARPDVALVTTVAAAHMAAFDGLAGIAREKAAIFAGLVPGGTAVVPSGLEVTPILTEAARAAGARIVSFGSRPDDDYALHEATLAGDTTIVQAARHGQPFLLRIRSAGRHFALNALGALAAAEAVGADPILAACDLGQWQPVAGRGQRSRVQLDILDDRLAFELIDDAYNANPTSLEAALSVLAAASPEDGLGRPRAGRRIAVLGDMLELGPDEAALHRAIADHPTLRHIALVHCVGPRMRHLWDALPRDKRGEWHETAPALAARARQIADAGDIVLVKGSKGSRVSLVVDALRKLGQPGAAETKGAE